MRNRKIWFAGLLPLLALPLMGDSCTKEKVVFISLGIDSTAGFIASGSENWHDDTDTIDVRDEIDLESTLDDNDIDASDVKSIKVSRVYYRITKADPVATRTITDGDVSIERINVGTSPIITNFTGAAGATTDWIEITNLLNSGGVTLINNFLADCLVEAQGGPAAPNTLFEYHVDGVSTPTGADTNFEWELKISFNVQADQTFDLPDF